MATVIGTGSKPSEVGVLGESQEAEGVRGVGHKGAGVSGTSEKWLGVYGESQEAEGVRGVGHKGAGVSGTSEKWLGVYGESQEAEGVRGVGHKGAGVSGTSEKWLGVYGESQEAEGVRGVGHKGAGVSGTSEKWVGVYGKGGHLTALRIAGQPCVQRLAKAFPNLVPVHGPVHASWLNQIEIYFSIVQRKALTPNDFSCINEVEDRLLRFQEYYENMATPFDWRFTRDDLARLTNKFVAQPSSLPLAA